MNLSHIQRAAKRGLLFGVLSLLFLSATTAGAVELKINITPKQYKEFLITANGTPKLTINQEATFDVPEGYVEVEIGKKKIRKFVSRPSMLQIYYQE